MGGWVGAVVLPGPETDWSYMIGIAQSISWFFLGKSGLDDIPPALVPLRPVGGGGTGNLQGRIIQTRRRTRITTHMHFS